jgi:hypothetical protein
MRSEQQLAGSRDLSWHLLPLDDKTVEHYREQLGLADRQLALEALGRSIVNSPGWDGIPGVTVLARPWPDPALAIVGHFDSSQKIWLRAQAEDLVQACLRFKYLDYPQVEQAVRDLAAGLRHSLGQRGVERAKFIALPRGGLIVLGLLAIELGLRHDQLTGAAEEPAKLLVIVDDCALSGRRFGETLQELKNPRVIFAHLASCPELREAILAAEQRVVDCISALDLTDHVSSQHSAEWRKSWLGRLQGHRYWIGRPDALAFPWGEPDRLIRTSDEEDAHLAWRLAPPERCMKNAGGSKTGLPRLSVQPSGPGPLRVADDIYFCAVDGEIFLGQPETGASFVLRGSAADIFRAVQKFGSRAPALRDLCTRYAVAASVLQVDLEHFVEMLMQRKILHDDGSVSGT